jgi:hypothetical protein
MQTFPLIEKMEGAIRRSIQAHEKVIEAGNQLRQVINELAETVQQSKQVLQSSGDVEEAEQKVSEVIGRVLDARDLFSQLFEEEQEKLVWSTKKCYKVNALNEVALEQFEEALALEHHLKQSFVVLLEKNLRALEVAVGMDGIDHQLRQQMLGILEETDEQSQQLSGEVAEANRQAEQVQQGGYEGYIEEGTRQAQRVFGKMRKAIQLVPWAFEEPRQEEDLQVLETYITAREETHQKFQLWMRKRREGKLLLDRFEEVVQAIQDGLVTFIEAESSIRELTIEWRKAKGQEEEQKEGQEAGQKEGNEEEAVILDLFSMLADAQGDLDSILAGDDD